MANLSYQTSYSNEIEDVIGVIQGVQNTITSQAKSKTTDELVTALDNFIAHLRKINASYKDIIY